MDATATHYARSASIPKTTLHGRCDEGAHQTSCPGPGPNILTALVTSLLTIC